MGHELEFYDEFAKDALTSLDLPVVTSMFDIATTMQHTSYGDGLPQSSYGTSPNNDSYHHNGFRSFTPELNPQQYLVPNSRQQPPSQYNIPNNTEKLSVSTKLEILSHLQTTPGPLTSPYSYFKWLNLLEKSLSLFGFGSLLSQSSFEPVVEEHNDLVFSFLNENIRIPDFYIPLSCDTTRDVLQELDMFIRSYLTIELLLKDLKGTVLTENEQKKFVMKDVYFFVNQFHTLVDLLTVLKDQDQDLESYGLLEVLLEKCSESEPYDEFLSYCKDTDSLLQNGYYGAGSSDYGNDEMALFNLLKNSFIKFCKNRSLGSLESTPFDATQNPRVIATNLRQRIKDQKQVTLPPANYGHYNDQIIQRSDTATPSPEISNSNLARSCSPLPLYVTAADSANKEPQPQSEQWVQTEETQGTLPESQSPAPGATDQVEPESVVEQEQEQEKELEQQQQQSTKEQVNKETKQDNENKTEQYQVSAENHNQATESTDATPIPAFPVAVPEVRVNSIKDLLRNLDATIESTKKSLSPEGKSPSKRSLEESHNETGEIKDTTAKETSPSPTKKLKLEQEVVPVIPLPVPNPAFHFHPSVQSNGPEPEQESILDASKKDTRPPLSIPRSSSSMTSPMASNALMISLQNGRAAAAAHGSNVTQPSPVFPQLDLFNRISSAPSSHDSVSVAPTTFSLFNSNKPHPATTTTAANHSQQPPDLYLPSRPRSGQTNKPEIRKANVYIPSQPSSNNNNNPPSSAGNSLRMRIQQNPSPSSAPSSASSRRFCVHCGKDNHTTPLPLEFKSTLALPSWLLLLLLFEAAGLAACVFFKNSSAILVKTSLTLIEFLAEVSMKKQPSSLAKASPSSLEIFLCSSSSSTKSNLLPTKKITISAELACSCNSLIQCLALIKLPGFVKS
ncbi:hypothetical protein WICPIJ_007656 [Wickerhamomyces pijperi]|uniref:Uncharacterized protein n=1 Tax=Wickerhamomyces pijperi TaxID=599730 RepID=A0A9P8Q1C2_WICPI|nr:hypothetical protein WICPIJ_007656 [Wickerhamomyces pijperi]